MKRSGIVELPLHYGKAPFWLVRRMKALSEQIFSVLIDEYGSGGTLRRLADPLWFQTLSCTLAYDWHSSGTTTVVCGVLKQALHGEEHGIALAGGKGSASRETLNELEAIGKKFDLGEEKIEQLKYSSRLAAKVDSAAVQDSYQLYHHTMIVTERGEWAVIQQGMNLQSRYARRYHWLSEDLQSFVDEPHEGIIGEARHARVLNMVARESRGARAASVAIACDNPKRIERIYLSIKPKEQATLYGFETRTAGEQSTGSDCDLVYHLPKRVDWDLMRRIYEAQPKSYEELLAMRGVGPATIRALALVSELVYGERASWRDPIKFSFAYGGKDGVPYPVDKKAMDESVAVLRSAVEEARLGNKEKLRAIRALHKFQSQARLQGAFCKAEG